jgi:hypothetical protein
MRLSKNPSITRRRLLKEMSELISLREKVAQAELDAGHLGLRPNRVGGKNRAKKAVVQRDAPLSELTLPPSRG